MYLCTTGAFLYVGKSAGTYTTPHANTSYLRSLRIVPHMLRRTNTRSLSTTLFGFPPIGIQKRFYTESELVLMRTAGNRRSLINKRSEGGALAPRWYQLYWPIHDSCMIPSLSLSSLHNRKPKADYEPLFPYLPSEILAMARGLRGREQEQTKAKEDAFVGQAWLVESNSGTYRRWVDLDFIIKEWEGPMVLKGIQSVRDAEKAVEVLMKDGREGGIIVSDHGGRQVDGAIPSILALQRILSSNKVQEARNPLLGSNKKKFHVLFDSGIRTGSDILKAVMLGADAVLIGFLFLFELGRPYVYASILGGQAGVEQVIQHLLADLEITMGLSGWDSLDEVRGKGSKSVLASVKGDMKGEMVGVEDGEEKEILIKVDC
ncbi:FMN-linked oxidoreductase [Dendrothele bispora CBS 962.96]|uniref:FMN-linked oxidoreductase n=1 Tax=Dendrothele bispora (strain CBS 962.96) TaxID=1314807 RepID=A0A4S8LTI5_DENBC|nr:FMN-linked oxidoreductase [Dendrothele bispora CBS 962.96]